MSEEDEKSVFQILHEIISFIKDTDLAIEEETIIRKDLIENIKDLLIRDNLDQVQRKIIQIILTKLYTWTPYHNDFKGLGEVPELIDQLFMTVDAIIPSEVTASLSVKYFKDDGNEVIHEDNPFSINLEEVLEQIKNFPTLEQYNNNHIGFLNEKKDSVQFTRLEEQIWLLDLQVGESGKEEISLNDDSLTTESVLEIVTSFFTEIDGTNEIRKRLEITDNIKTILGMEFEKGQYPSIKEIQERINCSEEEANNFTQLISSKVTYDEREIASLKLRARNAFKKFMDPNLYEMMVNLGMDFFTAKKVGAYLMDIGWIDQFPRLILK